MLNKNRAFYHITCSFISLSSLFTSLQLAPGVGNGVQEKNNNGVAQSSPLENLPQEISWIIFSDPSLTYIDLCSLTLTCHKCKINASHVLNNIPSKCFQALMCKINHHEYFLAHQRDILAKISQLEDETNRFNLLKEILEKYPIATLDFAQLLDLISKIQDEENRYLLYIRMFVLMNRDFLKERETEITGAISTIHEEEYSEDLQTIYALLNNDTTDGTQLLINKVATLITEQAPWGLLHCLVASKNYVNNYHEQLCAYIYNPDHLADQDLLIIEFFKNYLGEDFSHLLKNYMATTDTTLMGYACKYYKGNHFDALYNIISLIENQEHCKSAYRIMIQIMIQNPYCPEEIKQKLAEVI